MASSSYCRSPLRLLPSTYAASSPRFPLHSPHPLAQVGVAPSADLRPSSTFDAAFRAFLERQDFRHIGDEAYNGFTIVRYEKTVFGRGQE
jgi:hypothetical protein